MIAISCNPFRSFFLAAILALAPLAALTGCSSEGLLNFAADSRQKGDQLYTDGNYADAAGAFNNATKQDPLDYKSYYGLGRSYEAMKQYHHSVQSYRTCLDVMQRSLLGREDAAFRLKALDGLAGAVARGADPTLEAAARQDKEHPTVEDEFVTAKAMRLRGDADSALDAYSRALLLDPDNLAVTREYGLYLEQLGQAKRAAPVLKKAYVLNRKSGKGDDADVNVALRRVNVIPGPALAEEKDLVQPVVPRGPLPEVDVSKIRLQNPFRSEPEDPAAGGGRASAGPKD